MAGIYLHIPFCRKACSYCDFHFSTSTRSRGPVLEAMLLELQQRGQEVERPVGTVYFGGGTPSLLDAKHLDAFLRTIKEQHAVQADAEITLEANPDDITPERLDRWRELGINRLSLGTQSFREERLRWMGRAHNAEQALRSIALIARAGFSSWTIDLIYGLPGMDLAEWDEQLTIALDHGMPHLSAYCLTVEDRTALAHQVRKATVTMPGDDAQSAQFDRLMERMELAGLEHYEISNFARPGHRSRHNTAYWQGVPYLGIGPSAHSFNGHYRRWNVAHNARYAQALAAGQTYWEEELLSPEDRTNERLMTGLRTSDGVLLDALEVDVLQRHADIVDHHRTAGMLLVQEGRLVLTKAGRHFADRIAMELFISADDRPHRA